MAERVKLLRRASPPIVFKFQFGETVYFRTSIGRRRSGTIDGRVPCEPSPMYYVRCGNERKLLGENELEKQ